MEYSIQELSRLAGVSTRTLRYYDEIGLLKPCGMSGSGWRIYGSEAVDQLQQILFYRELGVKLTVIDGIIHGENFDRKQALQEHLKAVIEERKRLECLIVNLNNTIAAEEGRFKMLDKDKFQGFKKDLIDKNEKQYGKETREKYGDAVVEESNAKLMGLSEEAYRTMEAAGKELQELLEQAVKNQDAPEGSAGRRAAGLHKQWLSYTWPQYSKEAHAGVVEMYLADERFTAYYDKQVPGCAGFLRDAVLAYLG